MYVQAFGRPAKVRVSPSGGNWPVWRPDGKELFYEAGGDIMSVDIFPGEPVRLGAPPRKLFRSCEFTQELLVDSHTDFDISRDGKRFLLSCRAENSSPRSVTIATNWFHPTAQAQTNSRN